MFNPEKNTAMKHKVKIAQKITTFYVCCGVKADCLNKHK